MNETRNSLPHSARRTAVNLLNDTVGNLFDLYARTKQAHWNLRGDSFLAMHQRLDIFAGTITEHIDTAAERATALGGIVEGTLRSALKHSRLKTKQKPASKTHARDWIRELADSHATCSEQVRTATKKLNKTADLGSADLLTAILRDLDKQLWILEAHLNQ